MMEGLAIRFDQKLETIVCFKCGIVFAVPDYWRRKRIEDRTDFWCPNGHSQHYLAETEADKLRRELEATKKRLEIASAEATREFQLRRRLEKRIAKGVCPKCHRSFPNIRRHMETKHKEEEKVV